MRISPIGSDPTIKRLSGTKRDQVILSEVPLVMLEELEVVLFIMLGAL